MSEWKKERIDYAVTTYAGGTPNRSRDDYFNGDIPWISSGEVNQSFINKTKENITLLGLENSSARWIPKGAVLLAMYGATAGQVAKLKIRATANQAVLAMLPNEEIIDKDFLYHLLNIEKDRILFFAQGSGQPNLSKNLIDRYFISFPESTKTQISIARILDTCDTFIEQTQSTIAKYKAIKQGLLHDLFTRGLYTNGHLRPSYQQTPELYKESELGMIPKEWEVRRLGDIIDAIDPQPDHRTPESVENGIPYLGINDIDSFGNIDLRKCRKVSTVILEEHKRRYKIRNGDIIFGKIGTIGEPKKLNNFNNLTLSANVILIQPQGNSDFIYWYLLSETVNKQINNSIHTTSQPAFGMDKIRSLIIPMCDRIEQSEIAKRMNSIDNKIKTEEILLQKYQSIKRGLMGDLLGGRKEVKTLIITD